MKKSDSTQVPVQDPSSNYDAKERCLMIILSNGVLSGDVSINVVDNNTNSSMNDDDQILSTTASVNSESSDTLTKKTDLILPDLYDSSTDMWNVPIKIQIVSSENRSVHDSFTIWMEKCDSTLEGFSHWVFKSDKSTTMLIKERALKPNVHGDRADLNLLASTFIYKTANLDVQTSSRDKDIVDSAKEFRDYPTSQNWKKIDEPKSQIYRE